MSEDDSTDLRASLARWFERIRAHKWSRRHEFTEPEFGPCAQATGQLLLSWNDLHEARLSPPLQISDEEFAARWQICP
jgi:hypothetical protein